ncbi:MAG: polysaccharide biosynthesis C-terminal domain-containing protein [Saprospiraceae bacterium]
MNFEITNVRALQGSQIMRQGAAILISILLAKSVLTSEEIGTFEMLTFIGATLSFFWIAGLNQGILPFFPKLNSTDRRPFIFNIFLLFCAISTFVIVLLFLLENSITQLLVGQESLPFVKWYSIYLLFFMPSFLVDYIYLVNNRAKEILVFGVVVFTLQVLVVFIPLILGKGLLGSIQGLIGLGIFRFLWLLKVVFDFGKVEWKGEIMNDYLKLSIPLILYALLSGFPTVFDSWVVGWFYEDKSTFAIFRYGARELPLAIALANALSMAMIPEIVKNHNNAFTHLKNKTLSLFHWLFPLSIILMLTSFWWFPRVFNPDFIESASVFNVFLLVIISRLIFPQTILIALGKTKMVFYISILETILNIILSVILVQYFGLIGIAFGTVLAYLFEKIAIAIYLFFQHGISFSKYTPVGWFIFYSILLLTSYFFT